MVEEIFRLKSKSLELKIIHILISLDFFLCSIDMANSLSLRTLLDNNKLYGPNFDSWHRKLKIVLEHKRILYVILDPAPEEPATNAPRAVRDTYQKWLNDRTTV